MNSNWMNKVKVVGLMLVLGLLLFCAWKDMDRREKLLSQSLEEPHDSEEKEEVSERIVDPTKPMIALTFDDGPGKYTMQLLEQLETYGAKATFFLVGENVGKYSDVVRKMHEIGCEIGNHTMNHARLTTLADANVMAQISGTNEVVKSIVGKDITFLRPPYGSTDDRVAGLAGGPLIMWSVDTNDWGNKDATAVRNHVLSEVEDGDIILMHDIHETTVQATLELIPMLIEKGYQLVTISEMATARAVVLQNGLKYYDFKK